MPLTITLKPNERMILGGAVVTNGSTAARLTIENSVPVLREKDILSERNANTPCRRIYFAIQLMYVDERNLAVHHRTFWELARDVLIAAPSAARFIEPMSAHVLARRYYHALKAARELVNYEGELLKIV